MAVLALGMLGFGSGWSMSLEECMREQVLTAPDNATVAEIRAQCLACLDFGEEAPAAVLEPDKGIEDGLAAVRDLPVNSTIVVSTTWLERFTESLGSQLTPHRANYILPFAYNSSPNYRPYGVESEDFDKTEVKFQISLKYRLVRDVFGDNGDIYLAYTNESWWQAYNKDASSPFRETNHEPEAWLSFDTDRRVAGFRLSTVSFGINHESNGRAQDLSRSWNRIFAELVFEREDFWISLRPWYRIPEREKSSPDDPRGDDNPNMEKYFGYGELKAHYGWRGHGLSLMLRNNLRVDGNKGGVELGWIFPIYEEFKGYVQYFNGYGESLIDYNVPVNRIGVGFILSEWR
ncbi:MAG: phospholipase [Deltaproteobacteria bacterium]|nr:phospholipase [Deltaproteobacteria bacterium]